MIGINLTLADLAIRKLAIIARTTSTLPKLVDVYLLHHDVVVIDIFGQILLVELSLFD